MSQTYSLLVADDEKIIREGILRILAKEPVRITDGRKRASGLGSPPTTNL